MAQGCIQYFANRGIRTAPVFVTRIEDNEGNVLANFTPQMDEVISETQRCKWLVVTMLRAVVNEGTGGRVRRLVLALLLIWGEDRYNQP